MSRHRCQGHTRTELSCRPGRTCGLQRFLGLYCLRIPGVPLPTWIGTTALAMSSVLPVSFAYAVVKHRVLDVPLLLRRSARYLHLPPLLVDEKDFNPVVIDELRAEAAWDEARRALAISAIDYKGGGNDAHLTGASSSRPRTP